MTEAKVVQFFTDIEAGAGVSPKIGVPFADEWTLIWPSLSRPWAKRAEDFRGPRSHDYDQECLQQDDGVSRLFGITHRKGRLRLTYFCC